MKLFDPLFKPLPISNDQNIIQQVLNGDHNAFEQLMRKYNQRLYRIGISILKDEEEVPDVMQNCYLKAFDKLAQFKGSARFSTWLIRIMINESLARLKEKQKTTHLRSERLDDEDQESFYLNEIPDSYPDPEAATIHNETGKMAESAILSLPYKYRVVYIMKMIEEMTTKEISKALKISETNVKIRNYRAKQMIRKKMQELSGDLKDPFQFFNERCDQIVNRVLPQLKNIAE